MGGHTSASIYFAQSEHTHAVCAVHGVRNGVQTPHWCCGTMSVHAGLAKGSVVHVFSLLEKEKRGARFEPAVGGAYSLMPILVSLYLHYNAYCYPYQIPTENVGNYRLASYSACRCCMAATLSPL